MADIASSDVTYAIVARKKGDDSFQSVIADVSFGNGALTYPAGGIPLDKAKLGCPTSISELALVDGSAGDGFVYKYDATNLKVRVYQGDNNNASDGPLVELISGSAAPAATTLRVSAKGF